MTARRCKSCTSNFEVFAEDEKIYCTHQMPVPELCPDCREQLRACHINHLHLYPRQCAATGDRIVTHYPPATPLTIFSQAHWHSDAVDNTQFGRSFDFSRTFFEQFAELMIAVPRPALFTDYLRDENSAYTNYAGKNKDCYLIFDSDECWSCMYSYGINSSKNALDCYRGEKLERCIECIDSKNCYESAFLMNCDGCKDSAFLANCIGCTNCLFSSNLHQKRYHVMNQPVSPEEFEQIRRQLATAQGLQEALENFEEYRSQYPQKCQRGFQNDNALGNYLTHCRDAFHCFDCRDLRDGRYCFQIFMPVTNGMDLDACGGGELLLECSTVGYNAYNVRFTLRSLNQIRDLTYCDLCFNGCSDLFGCIGLKRKSYCILNMQYSKQEYEKLVPAIIAHMQQTGEWGQFFPATLSPFGYNVSIAQQFYPLSKEQAVRAGFNWEDDVNSTTAPKADAAYGNPPTQIQDVDTDAIANPFTCIDCAKPYRIISQELELYRELSLALPQRCFLCRHNRRLAKRSPRALWSRTCDKCETAISAAYDPQGKELVYCERCYLESLQ